MGHWAWIGAALSLLALLVIGWLGYLEISSRLLDRRLKRLQAEEELRHQKWRASATPRELREHDDQVRKNREMDLLKATNPREWERRLQSEAARKKSEARRGDASERAKWRKALLGLPLTPAVAHTSHRSWPRVHEITTRNDIESIIDFLIEDAALNRASPFVAEHDCLAANRDTDISTDGQRYYRVGEAVWQYHVERESHD